VAVAPSVSEDEQCGLSGQRRAVLREHQGEGAAVVGGGVHIEQPSGGQAAEDQVEHALQRVLDEQFRDLQRFVDEGERADPPGQ
jgi:hypothetical protein